MSVTDKPLDQLSEADLLELISGAQSEKKTLDYKRDQVGATSSDRKEFLADVSSFANTIGGHLILGMEEQYGLPVRLAGLQGIAADKEILRLEQMVREGIRPPIMGLQTQPVALADGSIALIIRIPQSWNPPHQVTFDRTHRFFARASNGKYRVDVDELRSIFSLSANVADRLRGFRIDRISKIVAGGNSDSDGCRREDHRAPIATCCVRGPQLLR